MRAAGTSTSLSLRSAGRRATSRPPVPGGHAPVRPRDEAEGRCLHPRDPRPLSGGGRELKTKPTQQSVASSARSASSPTSSSAVRPSAHLDLRDKLSMFCNVPVKAVIECRDVDSSIYQLPLALHREGMDELVLDLLGFSLPARRRTSGSR